MLSGLIFCFLMQSEPILPIPEPGEIDADKAAIGEQLYNDKRLSHSGEVSCQSCHALEKGGTIGMMADGSLNIPSIYNVSFNFRQFWDGRAKTLDTALEDHVHDKSIFGTDWRLIASKLKNIKEYSKIARPESAKEALVEYLKTLTTPNSRFDRYLKGEKDILSQEEVKGYELFKSSGCAACHQGILMGGNMFHKFGVFKDYYDPKTAPSTSYGRFNITGNQEDKFVFKVPSLRNVTKRAPYFHDGSAKTLENAIQLMAIYQLGFQYQPWELPLIVKFLETVSDDSHQN